MPTLMKNRPSSKPLNGSMFDSISCRYSESASNMPARNAPSVAETPARSINSATPMTTSSAVAVNTSTESARATKRNTGRNR